MGLAGAWLCNEGTGGMVNLVTGLTANAYISNLWGTGPDGIERRFYTGSPGLNATLPGFKTAVPDYSYFAIVRKLAAVPSDGSTVNGIAWVVTNFNSGNGVEFNLGNGFVAAPGNEYARADARGGGTSVLYLNGVAVTSGSSSAYVAPDGTNVRLGATVTGQTATDDNIQIGGWGGSLSQTGNIGMTYLLIYNRALTSTEQASLAADPYQMFMDETISLE